MIDKELLDILVCPVSKGKLEYDKEENVLICHESGLKYPIVDDIPIMIPERAEKIWEKNSWPGIIKMSILLCW